MRRYAHIAVLGFLLGAITAGAALADTCDSERLPQALETSMQQITSAEQFQKNLLEIDGHVSRCPDDPWMNLMGAVMDMQVYDAMVRGSNNQIKQDAYNYLLRAFARSNKFMEVPAEKRRDLLAVPLPSGGVGQLKFEAASANRRTIIESLMQIARLGSVHPYLAGETPPACDGWLNSDTQTIGYAIKKEADLIFQPFLDAAAEACRDTEERRLRLPLAVTATTYANLVGREEVTEREKVRELLEKARAARDTYLEGRDYDTFYSKFDYGRLDTQLRKHGIDPQAGLLSRDLWFTAEHIRSEKMVFSLAMALSEEWAGIAASMAAGTETASSAGVLYTRYVYDVLNQGRAAGLEAETRGALRSALRNVQESVVRAPAMGDHELPPQWLYDTLMNTAAAISGE